jgi:hypothetical protein
MVRRHKTAEGTKRQKAQNGRKHKTADDFYILIFILLCNVQANGQFLLITTTALQYDTPHILKSPPKYLMRCSM